MKVKDLMSTTVSSVKPDTPIDQIAKQMKQEDIGSLPVCDDNGHAIGIVTDRDIVLRSVSNGNSNVTAKDIMSKNLICAKPDMGAHEVASLFARNQVRRLPVVENNKVVGMIAMADIARKNIYIDEAGDALNEISKPDHTQMT